METIIEWCCPPSGIIVDTEENDIRAFVTTQLGREYRSEPCDADLLICAGSTPIGEFVGGLRQGCYAVAIVDPTNTEPTVVEFQTAGLTEYRQTTYTDESEAVKDVFIFTKDMEFA